MSFAIPVLTYFQPSFQAFCIPGSILRGNEFAYRGKPQQIAFLSSSAHDCTKPENVFWNVYWVNLYTDETVHWDIDGRTPIGFFSETAELESGEES